MPVSAMVISGDKKAQFERIATAIVMGRSTSFVGRPSSGGTDLPIRFYKDERKVGDSGRSAGMRTC